ncbi:aflatoxin B1 aldehyde reductase [Acrasis kona]|uniref:Aflatoxin B1 aldehyde reductase n=1 Tax=Acrasis kona TaxID=1008807 RepID=A0AAW2ZLI2_9EUKA
MPELKRVFGAYSIGKTNIEDAEKTNQVLNILKENNIKEIDTARAYGESERILGDVSAHRTFAISTKAPTFAPGSASKETLTSVISESLKLLQQDTVDIYYLHAPDTQTSFEEQASTLNEFYKKGSFKRLGISNFSAEQVQEFYGICKKQGYVLPSVYQGNYNAVTRNNEEKLFPVLRQLNISFYVYSPLAGGLFAKSLEDLRNPKPGTRFYPDTIPGQLYNRMYINDTFLNALELFQKICQDEKIKPAQAAFRWLHHHSKLQQGDAIILGASTIEQLKENVVDSIGSTLSDKVLKGFEEMWNSVADKAPNYHM